MTGQQIASTPDRTELVRIPLSDLVPHPLNPNVMPDELKAKLAANIGTSGRYPPLIVRPLDDGRFQIMDGHQRADILRELGETTAVCYVWPASDEEALILVATLNRLEGQDIPGKRAALISELQAHHALAELARLLPEDEAQLEATLDLLDFDVEGLLARLTEEADRASAQGPQLFAFAVEPEDAPAVEEAVERAASMLHARNASRVGEVPDEQGEVGSVATTGGLGEVAQGYVGSLVVEKAIPQALIRLSMRVADRD